MTYSSFLEQRTTFSHFSKVNVKTGLVVDLKWCHFFVLVFFSTDHSIHGPFHSWTNPFTDHSIHGPKSNYIHGPFHSWTLNANNHHSRTIFHSQTSPLNTNNHHSRTSPFYANNHYSRTIPFTDQSIHGPISYRLSSNIANVCPSNANNHGFGFITDH